MLKTKIDWIRTTDENFGLLAVCALRYCQGRRTYMPDTIRGIVRPHLTKLTDKALGVMIRDCEEQARDNIYGDEHIDKPGWVRWEQELKAEKERRNSND